jgi:hypothetical protein
VLPVPGTVVVENVRTVAPDRLGSTVVPSTGSPRIYRRSVRTNHQYRTTVRTSTSVRRQAARREGFRVRDTWKPMSRVLYSPKKYVLQGGVKQAEPTTANQPEPTYRYHHDVLPYK